MGRGLLLGIAWGVLIATVAGTTLSLVYSDGKGAGLAGNTPAAVATDVIEAEAEAPAIGTVDAPSQGEAPAQSDAEVLDIPDTDTPDISTPAPAAPEMAQTDTPPANSGSDLADAPDVMIPDETSNEGAMLQNEGAVVAIAPQDAQSPPSAVSALPDAPKSETQPATDSQSGAMTAPEMQDGPEAGDGAPPAQEQSNAPDVQVVELPKAATPDQPQSPQSDATLPKVAPAPEMPAEAKPEVGEPETSTPKSDGVFDTARLPVPKMANLAPNVKTNRLPTIGGARAQDDAPQQERGAAPDLGALSAYAMGFENPDARPMFSVVLIDDPQNPVPDDVLSHLPFALSFAIDAVRDDADAVAARYRAAGFEVLMLTNLPFGASATDIEVAFGAYSRAIPEAIGVLDLGANGFLRGPSTATQIAGIMADRGYGLITPSKGLNSAQKAAMREGVPAVLLFRELDEDGEKPSVIRRYLDRAAFRATQEGHVIMLGHTRPATIEALVTWALEDRAASVAIAPVSAILLAQ